MGQLEPRAVSDRKPAWERQAPWTHFLVARVETTATSHADFLRSRVFTRDSCTGRYC